MRVEKSGCVNTGKLDFLGANVSKYFSASTNGRVNVRNIGFLNVLTLNSFHAGASSSKV